MSCFTSPSYPLSSHRGQIPFPIQLAGSWSCCRLSGASIFQQGGQQFLLQPQPAKLLYGIGISAPWIKCLKAQLLSWFCFLILLKLAYCLSSGKVTSQSLFSKAILFDCCLVMGRYLISNSPLSSPHSLVLPSVSQIFICAKWVGWHVFFYFDF